MVPPAARLLAAVANNAAWCDAVCRSHGYPGEFTARSWLSPRHRLPFYPNAITLTPDATAADTRAARNPDRAYGVKDSFARLDLAPAGLTPLFDAEWITWDPVPPEKPAGERPPADDLHWRPVRDAAGLAGWEAAWSGEDASGGLFRPDLLADAGCAVLGCYREGALAAGTIAYTAGSVTSISNMFTTSRLAMPGPGTLWRSTVRAVAALRPGLPVVGYENGQDLAAARAAGGRVIGPLRVWTRGSAVS